MQFEINNRFQLVNEKEPGCTHFENNVSFLLVAKKALFRLDIIVHSIEALLPRSARGMYKTYAVYVTSLRNTKMLFLMKIKGAANLTPYNN